MLTEHAEPRLRLATSVDAEAIDALMKASIRDLFPASYDACQTASSMVHIGHVDPMLIDPEHPHPRAARVARPARLTNGAASAGQGHPQDLVGGHVAHRR